MKKVDVAAAVILRPDGSFLLGQRAPGTFYPGYWEFPGGKVEPGEKPRQAMVRELHEELAIEVETAHPWIVREHVDEHADVRLHFFRVVAWHGELRDHVHSALSWQRADALDVAPMLATMPLPPSPRLSSAGPIGLALMTFWFMTGCTTGPAPIHVAAEQQRCAAVWRARGDSDRAIEMQRRSKETRRNEASAHSQDAFLAGLLDLLLSGVRSSVVQDSRPYLDPRGCEY